MKIIGIAGRKRSGKDTAGDLFVNNGFLRIKFADCLKAMIKTMLVTAGIDPEEADELIEGPRKEEPQAFLGGKTIRWAMQSLGTDWGRNLIDINIWCSITAGEILAWKSNAVITDLRFPNEADTLRNLGATLIRIERDTGIITDTHETERFIDGLDVDHVITNNGTIDELHLKLMKFL